MTLTKSYWFTSGVYTLGTKFSVLVFGFGSFYFLIRNLPQEQFGIWALFLTITTIIETSRNGLVQNALIKLLYSSSHEDQNKVVSASWLINISYSTLIYLILCLVSGVLGRLFNSDELSEMFLWYGITLGILVPFSQFNFIQQAKFSFSGMFWSTLIRQGSFFLAIIIFYVTEYEIPLTSLVLLQAACTLAGMIVAFFSAAKFMQFRFELDWIVIKKAFHFGKYVMGTNISSLLFKSTDQLMIGSFLTSGSVALYNSAIRLSNLIEYPTTAIAEVVYPKSVAKFEEGGDLSSKLFFEKSVGLTMAITVPIVILTFFLADYIILFIAGPSYIDAAGILRITILFGLFTPFFRQFGTAMDSSGRPHLNFTVLSCSVIINVICNFIGLSAIGLIGAAYGTLCTYLIINFVCYIVLVKIFNIEIMNIFKYMGDYYKIGFNTSKILLKKFHGG